MDSAIKSRERATSHSTLSLFNLSLQNFPWLLAFRISNYNTLTPSGQLFAKIWPQGREIFMILWKYFWKKRLALGARGKPPTIVYRARWLVEPFSSNHSHWTIINREDVLDASPQAKNPNKSRPNLEIFDFFLELFWHPKIIPGHSQALYNSQ